MKRLIALSVFIIVVFSFIINCSNYFKGISNDSIEMSQSQHKQYEKSEELRRAEERNPNKNISTRYVCWKNANDEIIVEGYINNHSSVATFKDVTFKVDFYSETNDLLQTATFEKDGYLIPDKEVYIKQKFNIGKMVKRVQLVMLDAKVI